MNIQKGMLLNLLSLSGLAAHPATLHDLVKLAATYQEEVAGDTQNFNAPDFSTHLKTMRPTLVERFFGRWKKGSAYFDIRNFIRLLREVTHIQQSKGRMGDFIAATQVNLEDKMVIFGTIQGAFHSLVRDLQELKKQRVIDDTLKIIDPHYYFIFNGTVVARSPYILQTLLVVLLLMKQNPDKVFYVKSNFEERKLWADGNLAEQLDVIYRKHEQEVLTLFGKFVETLPQAFYVNCATNPERLLKITALRELEYDTFENQTGDFFSTLKPHEISIWPVSDQKTSPTFVYTSLLIEGTDPSIMINSLRPLTILGARGAASAWRVFSAANSFYKDLYHFEDDAFATIIFGKELDSSIIEVFSRNRLRHEPFKLSESLEINTYIHTDSTRQALSSKKEEILIGSTFDLSRGNFVMGDRLRTGILAALNHVNNFAAMKDKVIKDIILDDKYTSHGARENVARFKKEFNVSTILLPVGTPTIIALQDLIVSGSILAAFPVTGSVLCRNEDMKGIINFRASYAMEVEKLLTYIINEYKFKTFALLYQDDVYGADCMTKAREILKANGITRYVEIPYAPNATEFNRQIELFKEKQVEALACFSDPQPTRKFLQQLGTNNLSGVKVFAISFVVDDAFESFVTRELGLKCIFSRVVPHPALSTLELVAEYRKYMDALRKRYDVYSLEGYIGTSILCDMIKRVPPSTHTALLAELESLNNYNFKGLSLTFDPKDRQLSKRVWLDLQDGNDWKEI